MNYDRSMTEYDAIVGAGIHLLLHSELEKLREANITVTSMARVLKTDHSNHCSVYSHISVRGTASGLKINSDSLLPSANTELLVKWSDAAELIKDDDFYAQYIHEFNRKPEKEITKMIVPNSRISPADPDKPVTDEYLRALNLNKKIIVSAQLAQQNLYEMCAGFKEMRDSKLYKELGYSDFGEYCEQETGIKRRQVYNYIAVVERLSEDFVHSSAQIGVKKLSLLATLDEEEREQITSGTDLESATVKQLEQQIKQLRADKDKAVAEKSAAEADLALKSDTIAALEKTRDTLDQRATALEKQIKELESRPIEVVTETVEKIPDNYINVSAYEKLVAQNNAEREQAEAEYLALKRQLGEVERQLEEERSKPAPAAEADDTAVFNALVDMVTDALEKLETFVLTTDNKFTKRYDQLLKSYMTGTEQ